MVNIANPYECPGGKFYHFGGAIRHNTPDKPRGIFFVNTHPVPEGEYGIRVVQRAQPIPVN